jgi:glyoxylase-like metal-dependent hydrolase (beta-lactamase superfamily II)
MHEGISEVRIGPAGIRFEVSRSPWFGPRKRGRRILEQATVPEPVSPHAFIEYLTQIYPDVRSGIQFVRFHDCEFEVPAGSSWRQSFAVISTLPNAWFRQVLFDDAQTIADATGWYGLVMGRRQLERRASAARWLATPRDIRDAFGSHPFGSLRRVVDLSTGQGGTALGLEFDGGLLALDFGFQTRPDAIIRGGLLSHHHRDHADGLLSLASPIAVICSDTTALHVRRRRGQTTLLPVQPPSQVTVSDLSIRALPGRHVPGSVVFMISGPSDEIVYTGDYCLSNAHASANPSDLLRHFTGKRRATLLLDATFVGHEPQPGEIRDLAASRKIVTGAFEQGRSIIFAASTPDPLMPAYLWHFRDRYSSAQRTGRHLVVDEQVLWQLERTFESVILRRHHALDPYVEAHIGRSMSNYLESVWMYPASASRRPTGPGDFFLVGHQAVEETTSVGPDPLIFTLGRDDHTFVEMIGAHWPNADVHALTGPDFAFHSAESDVRAIARLAGDNDIRVVLFHNYAGRIKKAFRAGPLIDVATAL